MPLPLLYFLLVSQCKKKIHMAQDVPCRVVQRCLYTGVLEITDAARECHTPKWHVFCGQSRPLNQLDIPFVEGM